MHSYIVDSIATPKSVKKRIERFLKRASPSEGEILEIKIWRKTSEKSRRKLLKVLQILFHRPDPTADKIEAYYHISNNGSLWRYIRFWMNVLIPDYGLWCSVESLVDRRILDLASVRNINLEEFEVTYHLKENRKTKLDDIASIKEAESGEAKELGGFIVTRKR